MQQPTTAITATGIWTKGHGVRPWRSNAELIALGVVGLGYLRPDDRVLDPTFGRGAWWKDWSPSVLVHHDIDQDGVDFRALPYADGEFDVVAFDPPYVCTGGRETSTLGDFNDRYGLRDAPRTPEALLAMNVAGLDECWRVVGPGGLVLCKTANYVWSGHLYPGAHLTLEHALSSTGFKLEDSFVYAGNVRAQPVRSRKCAACSGSGVDSRPGNAHGEPCIVCGGEGRVQSEAAHARQNVSYLYVLRRPRSAKVVKGSPALPLA